MRAIPLSFIGLVVVSFAVAAPPRKPSTRPAARQAPRKLPKTARLHGAWDRLVFLYESGSCWGSSTEKRIITHKPKGVEIQRSATSQSHARSQRWWRDTQRLLNRGLAASTRRPKGTGASCYAPNWICGFTLHIWSGKKKRTISGCCTHHKQARAVTKAFRRLAPGGPLAAPKPPAR